MIKSHTCFVISFFKIDLKEKRFSFSHTKVRLLWVSTQDQLRTVLFNLNFDSPKFSLLNLNEVWIVINAWSFSLIFFFSSSLELLLALCCYKILATSKLWDAQHLGHGTSWDADGRVECPREEKGREREGVGRAFEREGLLVLML